METKPIRKRMKRWEVPGGVRFVTFSCERRLPLLGNAAIRDLFVDRLAAMRKRFGCELFAWVVMPEHVHLVLRPTEHDPLDRVLEFMKKAVARRVIARWRAIDAPILSRLRQPDGSPRFWQKGGGFDRSIRDEGEFDREVRYVHRNPVKRGLVAQPRDWAWSSARWWLGESMVVECDPVPWIAEHDRRLYV